MKKKQYIKPVVLFEEMEVTDCILGVSKTETVTNLRLENTPGTINPTTVTPAISNTTTNKADSKESDWSYDYSFDLDW